MPPRCIQTMGPRAAARASAAANLGVFQSHFTTSDGLGQADLCYPQDFDVFPEAQRRAIAALCDQAESKALASGCILGRAAPELQQDAFSCSLEAGDSTMSWDSK